MKIELDGLSKHIHGTGNFISIDDSKCNGCSKCAIICIVNLWKIKEGLASITDDYKNKCLECGSCAQVCEPGAINFMYPAGGTGVIYEQG
ncbi:MAG: 4Fe-4S dicluster domain-containing protein [Candidatus Hermodarchaeota archaeon]